MSRNDTGIRLLRELGVGFALLTRLPLPALPRAGFDRQARAVWSFPVVGAATGLIAVGAAWIALAAGVPVMLAAGMMLGMQMLLTGAMHEDGLADTADGFWGGFTVQRRLEIMKDSQIGTYGVLALILGVGLRWMVSAALLEAGAFAAIVAAAAWSRAMLPALMSGLPNARGGGLSHNVGTPGAAVSAVSVALGAVIVFGFAGLGGLAPMLLAGVAVGVLALLAMVKIAGQTGDVLGAAQQTGEIGFLVTLLALSV